MNVRSLFNIILLLLTTVIITPQKYNVSEAHINFKNSKLKIFGGVYTLELNYNNFEKDYILITVNDSSIFKVETIPYKIEGEWKYYNLYNRNIERYFNNKRIFEIKCNYYLQELTIDNHLINKQFIITFYDDSNLKINFN